MCLLYMVYTILIKEVNNRTRITNMRIATLLGLDQLELAPLIEV
jgi:hypothetical protein